MTMRFKFYARQTSVHSPFAFPKPRNKNWLNPVTDLMMSKWSGTTRLAELSAGGSALGVELTDIPFFFQARYQCSVGGAGHSAQCARRDDRSR